MPCVVRGRARFSAGGGGLGWSKVRGQGRARVGDGESGRSQARVSYRGVRVHGAAKGVIQDRVGVGVGEVILTALFPRHGEKAGEGEK